MNTNLLLTLGCLQQAHAFALKAEKELYLNELVVECDDAVMALQNAIDAINDAMAGCIQDTIEDHSSTNTKATVTYLDFNRKVIK